MDSEPVAWVLQDVEKQIHQCGQRVENEEPDPMSETQIRTSSTVVLPAAV